MRVAMTYDLKDEYRALGYSDEAVAEFDGQETIDAIANTLDRLGHEVEQVGHVQALVSRLARGTRWDLVFNIAEGINGRARESQVPALLDAYAIPYTFSDPSVLAVCLDKQLAKLVVRSHGLRTPDSVVVHELADIERVHLPLPMFAKPISEGSSRGVTGQSVVRTRAQLNRVCRLLLSRYEQPILVERFLPGREFTVGILGTGNQAEVLGVMEVSLTENAEADVYSYDNKQQYEDRVRYVQVEDPEAQAAGELALQSYRVLGCRDAGRIDVRSDEHRVPNFIEANPLAGLNPILSDLAILARAVGLPYETMLARIVDSASGRAVISRVTAAE